LAYPRASVTGARVGRGGDPD